MDIAQAFVENPHLSLRLVSDERDVAPEIVRNILKSINLHPYTVHLVQELNEDDPDRRVEFCEIMMDRMKVNFKVKIKFTIECPVEKYFRNCTDLLENFVYFK